MTITTTHLLIFLLVWFINENVVIKKTLQGIQYKLKFQYKYNTELTIDKQEGLSLFKRSINVFIDAMYGIVFCIKCLTFWLILLFTWQILPALLFSFIGSIYQKMK